MGKLESGILLQVTKPGFMAHKMMNESERKIGIEVGDLIEITIAYEWHFRTLDDDYFVAPEDEILKFCTPFAKRIDVFELRGTMSLEEIIRYRFYKGLGKNGGSGYREMPDFEAYKSIRLKAFDKVKEKQRGFIERQTL